MMMKKRMATMFNPEDKAYIKVNTLLTVSVTPWTILLPCKIMIFILMAGGAGGGGGVHLIL